VEAEVFAGCGRSRPEAVARVLRRPLVEGRRSHVPPPTAELVEIEAGPASPGPAPGGSPVSPAKGGTGRLDVPAHPAGRLVQRRRAADPRFRRPHRSKPDIVLLCGREAALLPPLPASPCRSCMPWPPSSPGAVLCLRGRPHEVTRYFGPGTTSPTGEAHGGGARLVWLDGRSDLRACLAVRGAVLGPAQRANDGDRHGTLAATTGNPNMAALHRIAQSSRLSSGSTPSGAGRGTRGLDPGQPTEASATGV